MSGFEPIDNLGQDLQAEVEDEVTDALESVDAEGIVDTVKEKILGFFGL